VSFVSFFALLQIFFSIFSVDIVLNNFIPTLLFGRYTVGEGFLLTPEYVFRQKLCAFESLTEDPLLDWNGLSVDSFLLGNSHLRID